MIVMMEAKTEVTKTEITKLFTVGNSQIVRLPYCCQFGKNEEVMVRKVGNIVILIPKNELWQGMSNALNMFTDDYLADGIEDLPLQERSEL